MPYQMAMAVAHGKLDLSEALERMATKDRVAKLMQKHDLSRALATQIAIGHADLAQVLARRRLDDHRRDYRDRTCLTLCGDELALALHGGGTARGTVMALEPYSITLQTQRDETLDVHKLQMKFAYNPANWKAVKKVVKTDKKAPKGGGGPPATKPQDRYSCSDRRLFGFMDRSIDVQLSLLDGDHVKGQILWFGRYEFGLKMKGDVEITVFRHALRNLSGA